jgi:transposase
MDNLFSKFIGIDVSKESIHIFSTETSSWYEITNAKPKMSEFFTKFDSSKSLVILENTGGYERECMRVLKDLDFKIHRTDNVAAKHYFLSLGNKAKTDKIDAKSLAMYGEERHKKLKTFVHLNEKQEEIRALTLYLENLKNERVKEKNRLKSPGCESIRDIVQNTLNLMNNNIADIEKKLTALVKEDDETKAKLELMTSYKGIGETTAIKLLAFLPELGSISKNAVVSLSGLAPYANNSGKKKSNLSVKHGGRPNVRKALFMTAFSATRYDQNIAAFYQHLLKNGKPKMVALTACMRKIIVQLNAILRDRKNS